VRGGAGGGWDGNSCVVVYTASRRYAREGAAPWTGARSNRRAGRGVPGCTSGKDPLSGREIRFRKTRRTEVEAQIELGKLLALARNAPTSRALANRAPSIATSLTCDQPARRADGMGAGGLVTGSAFGRCGGLASSGRGPQAASFKVGAQGAEGQGKDLQLIESDGLAEDLLDCCLLGGLCRDTADSPAGVSASREERREIRDDIHEAFLTLAIICWRPLRNLSLC
jgi:hypothetical protein